MAPINVTTSKQQITASVAEDKVTATVSAGFGAVGPQGPSGVINVTAPITNSGTTTAANVGLSVGSGLAVSGGSLVLGTHTHDDRYYTEAEVNNLLSGYATLVGGKVPSSQLPSYVDDVIEVATYGDLPSPGESGKIYLVTGTNKVYRWTGFVWLEIVASPGSTDSLAEGSVNLYHTTQRAANAAPVQSVAGKTGAVVLAAGDIASGTLSASRLPIAAAGTLGAVRIGSGISIDSDGIISASAASVAWGDITSKPSTFAPSAHAASHAAGGADQLFDQVLSTTNSPTFAGLQLNGGLLSTGSANFQTPTGGLGSGFVINPTTGALTWPDGTTQNTAGSAASHAHGSITSAGAIGTTSGLIVTTGASGVLGTLAMGTAGQVLKVNSGATGVEWVTLGGAAALNVGTTAGTVAAGDHTHTQLHDRSHAITSTSDHTAGNWKVLYTNGSGQVVELGLGDAGKALVSNGASAAPSWATAGSNSASDLTTGTLAYARMADPTVTSPSQITGSQNDYASFARGINRFTTNGAYNLTGMVAGNDGEVRVLCNTGTTAANTLTIKDESSSSTAANRFTVPWSGDCVIPALGSVVVYYDGTSSRWRVV